MRSPECRALSVRGYLPGLDLLLFSLDISCEYECGIRCRVNRKIDPTQLFLDFFGLPVAGAKLIIVK
jgi:hypothetical protein